MVFNSSFSFDVAYNSATIGTAGSGFGNLSGLPGPAEWQDLNGFGFGACYCVTLASGDPEPGACCIGETCSFLLPTDCAAMGGSFVGGDCNDETCLIVGPCDNAAGDCCDPAGNGTPGCDDPDSPRPESGVRLAPAGRSGARPA